MPSSWFDAPVSRRRWCALGGLGLTAWVLPGCAAFNHEGPDAAAPQPVLTPLAQPPRLAVVLGSGGPRGYAHIGLMRVLQEAGIRPDLIVGASVGALLGAFWAAGVDAAVAPSPPRRRPPVSRPRGRGSPHRPATAPH